MLFSISFKGTGLGKREWENGRRAGILRDLNCNRFLSNHDIGHAKKTEALGGPECLGGPTALRKVGYWPAATLGVISPMWSTAA